MACRDLGYYQNLADKIGCTIIDSSIINRFESLTGTQAHVFLRRNLFFAHRDLNEILDCYERGEKFFLYIYVRHLHKSFHIGHLLPFIFAKYLQDAFKVPLIIQVFDEEKPLGNKRLVRQNVANILACGFDISRTYIFEHMQYDDVSFHKNMSRAGKCIKLKQVNKVYGLTGQDSLLKLGLPAIQAAPAFPSSFPHLFSEEEIPRCLIPCAIDQDSRFRMTRDIARRLHYNKPALIESLFLPVLQGGPGKISDSPDSAIYVTDSPKKIKNKVHKFAFSGANQKVEIPFKYLSFFLEDDEELEHIRKEYFSGRMLSSEVEKRLIDVLIQLIETHRAARAMVTDKMVDDFMSVRPLPNKYN